MTQVSMTAESRSDFGKGASRRLRRAGRIPAVIYGEGSELIHVSLPGHDLELALRKPRVVLEVQIPGGTRLTKPRDVQRDPVRLTLEHVDLVVITAGEASDRAAMAQAIHDAETAAAEAGMDPAAAVAAMEDAIAQGENPSDAAEHAVSDAEAKAEEYTEANRAAEAAEAAESSGA
ncbi:MAG: 50S ribosomal protein L25 [Actinomycetales bacterium]|nr:50S ribosomal protein L25 [Actinomycetales bacterium]